MDIFGIKLKNPGVSQIENVKLETLAAHPAAVDSWLGRLYFNSGDNKFYYCTNATTPVYVAIATGGDATALQTEVDALETSLGAGVNTSGVFQSGAFAGTYTTGATSFTNAIMLLDSALNSNNTFAELDDVTLTTPASGHIAYYNGSLWVNAAPGATSGVQPYDAGLASIAGLTTAADTMIYTTAADTYATTTITAFGRSLVDDADAAAGRTTLGVVIGTNVQAYDAGLAALASFNTNGFLVQTADNTFAGRSIVGTAGNIVVTDGDGVAGNATLNLATVTQGSGGNFVKVTLDTFGRVTQNTAVVQGDVTALVDSVYVNVSGDTMAGTLSMNSFQLSGIVAPTASDHAANKGYVDGLVTGLSWKNAVRVASTGNIDLSTALENTDVVDGVTLATGDRVLVKDQTTASQNGIYIVQATGAAVRATDMDAASEFDGAAVFVKEGTTNQNTGWTQTATVATVGTDSVSWQQFSGGAVYTWGTGLSNSGNDVFIKLGAGITELPSDEVGVDVHISGGLFTTVDNSASSTLTGAQLAIKLDGATLSKGASGLKITAAGVTEVELNASVAGNGLSGGAGTALAVNVDNSSIEINADSLRVKASGVTNAMLANPAITFGGDTVTDAVNLGETVTIAGGTGIVTVGGANTVTVNFDASDITAAGADAATGDTFVGYDSSATATRTFTLAELGNGIAGEIALGDLSNVGTAPATAGYAVIGDGSAFNSKKIMHKTALLAAATSHVVTHSLNQRLAIVQVYDSSYNQIIPNNISLDSTTQCTVSFGTNSVQCYIVVMSVEGA